MSDRSLDYFEANAPYDFTNEVLVDIDPSEYEVGLAELYYYDNYTTARQSNTTTTPSTLENGLLRYASSIGSWFNRSNSENKIKVRYIASMKAEMPKGQKNLDQFVSEFALMVNREIPSVQMVPFQIDQNTSGISLKIRDAANEGRQLEFGPAVAEILGLTQRVYGVGDYTPIGNVSQAAYDKIPYTEQLWARWFVWREGQISVPEPDHQDSLEAVLEECADALSAGNFEVRFVITPDGTVLYVMIDTPDITIQLPKVINKTLGLDENFVMDKSSMRIILPIHKVQQDQPDLLIVQTNIIKPVQFGDTGLGILRMFPRIVGTLAYHHKIFDAVQFHPLNSQHIHNINISLVTQNFEYLTLSTKASCAVLEFRKKI